MKKRIFSIATLMVVLAVVIMTGCNKKESPSIKKAVDNKNDLTRARNDRYIRYPKRVYDRC